MKDSNQATISETSPARNKQLSTPKAPHPSAFRSELTGLPHRHRPRKERQHANPYSIPRSHTVHSSADLRPSLERLAPPGLAPDPAFSSYQETSLRAPQPVHHRRAVSEHGSPVPNFDEMGAQVPAIDIPYHAVGPTSLSPAPMEYQQRSAGSPYPSDVDGLWDSANLSVPPVDWSTFDFHYASDTMTNSVSHPGSFASFDYNNYGHLTRSSSRVTSEPGDLSPVAGMHMQGEPQHRDFHGVNDAADKDTYRLSTPGSSLDITRPQMVASPTAIDGTDPFPQHSKAGVPHSIPAPSLIISQEPDHYFSHPAHGLPIQHRSQPQPQPPQAYSTVGGPNSQPLVSHGPLTTAISEPSWHPTSYPTTATPSPHPMAIGGLVYSGHWSQ